MKSGRCLLDLIAKIQPDDSWGIWAETPFTPDSPARYGQMQFENGGMLDDAVFFADGMQCGDFISEYWEDMPYNEIDNKMRTEAAEALIIEKEESRIKSIKIINREIDGIDYDIIYEFPADFEGSPICPICGIKLLDVADEPGFRCENEDCEKYMMQICSISAFVNDPCYDELIKEFESY